MSQMPSVSEARQLLRLRSLRVQRAREQIPPAQARVEQAHATVVQRQRQIAHLRHETVELRDAIVTTLAPRLPRWSQVTTAQQELLADQLERAEFALIDEEQALEAAQEQLQQARSELTRALAREDAVRGLAEQAKRCRAQAREQRAEREVDDQIRPTGGRLAA